MHRSQYWKTKKRVTIYLISCILLTICMCCSVWINASWLYLAVLIGIGCCAFIPKLASILATIASHNYKRYYNVITGSRLIIYGFDCGMIILSVLKSL